MAQQENVISCLINAKRQVNASGSSYSDSLSRNNEHISIVGVTVGNEALSSFRARRGSVSFTRPVASKSDDKVTLTYRFAFTEKKFGNSNAYQDRLGDMGKTNDEVSIQSSNLIQTRTFNFSLINIDGGLNDTLAKDEFDILDQEVIFQSHKNGGLAPTRFFYGSVSSVSKTKQSISITVSNQYRKLGTSLTDVEGEYCYGRAVNLKGKVLDPKLKEFKVYLRYMQLSADFPNRVFVMTGQDTDTIASIDGDQDDWNGNPIDLWLYTHDYIGKGDVLTIQNTSLTIDRIFTYGQHRWKVFEFEDATEFFDLGVDTGSAIEFKVKTNHRAIARGRYYRVGSIKHKEVSARVISADSYQYSFEYVNPEIVPDLFNVGDTLLNDNDYNNIQYATITDIVGNAATLDNNKFATVGQTIKRRPLQKVTLSDGRVLTDGF